MLLGDGGARGGSGDDTVAMNITEDATGPCGSGSSLPFDRLQ